MVCDKGIPRGVCCNAGRTGKCCSARVIRDAGITPVGMEYLDAAVDDILISNRDRYSLSSKKL